MPPIAVKIRQARLGDLSRVCELEAFIWKEMGAPETTLKRRFQRFPAGFLVAEDSIVLSGFCMALRVRPECVAEDRASRISLDDHQNDGEILFLLGLTVDPVFRRRGIGSALVGAELDLARRLGCRAVHLVANDYSRGLFLMAGFEVIQDYSELEAYQGFEQLMPHPVQMAKCLLKENSEHQCENPNS